MRMTRLGLLLLGAVVAGTAACDDDNNNGPSSTAHLRVIHASPDAPAVDVLVEGKTLITGLEYGNASDYHNVASGTRTVSVNETGTVNALITASPTFKKDSSYTIIAADLVATAQPLVLEDDLSSPAAGNAKVRLVHGSPGAGLVDIYITAPGADISALIPTFSNVAFAANTGYSEVPAGDYQVRVTAAGTKTVAIDTGTLTLASGEIATAVALDEAGGGSPFTAVVFTDDE